MLPRRTPRLYTVDEARALVPRLRPILQAIQAERRELAGEIEALQRLTPAMRGNGHGREAARHERRIAALGRRLQGRLAEVAALGIEIKDPDSGLVDFFSERDGRVVYLCWRVDEPTVGFWHELDGGFRGRQPLDP